MSDWVRVLLDRLSNFEARMDTRIDELDGKLNRMEATVDRLDRRQEDRKWQPVGHAHLRNLGCLASRDNNVAAPIRQCGRKRGRMLCVMSVSFAG